MCRKVALVLTRPLSENPGFGRERTLSEIRKALHSQFDARDFRLQHLFETRKVGDFVYFAWQWLRGVLSGRPIPLQTLLYSCRSEARRLLAFLENGEFDVIYLDSVRCQLLIRAIRNAMPDVRIVSDFDDLMSRRAAEYARQRIPLSLGFLQSFFHRTIQRVIASRLSAVFSRYEAFSLVQAEREIARSVDAITLVSSAECALLGREVGTSGRATIHAVPPPATPTRSFAAFAGPYRFVFIGSDMMVQNRLSIDILLGIWNALKPSTPLHIYGRQVRELRALHNVYWHGFVQHVEDVYVDGSILALPAVMAGGIKTKVIETWSYACPVIGNTLAFEGLEIPGYPLVLPLDQWQSHIVRPEAHALAWATAARMGNQFTHDHLSQQRYADSWRAIMNPGISPSALFATMDKTLQ